LTLTRLLFETPWWLPTMLIGVGVFVWITGNRRVEKPVMAWGLAIAALGILVILLSVLVDTDREKCFNRTKLLVTSAGQRDWTKFQSLIDPQTSIYGLRGPEEITSAAKTAAERINLSSAWISSSRVEQTGTVITVDVRIISEQFQGNPAPSDWRFTYQNFGQGFVLYTVNVIDTRLINEQTVRARINRYREEP
jgi:hypothetical protein